jgi:hypothetical protein
MEEENQQLAVQLEDMRRKLLLLHLAVSFLQVFPPVYTVALGCPGIVAQAAAAKTLLKTQIDDLSAENSSLKLKTESLADELSKLKVESSAAQELANKQRADAESKEKGLQHRLLATLDSLHGEYHPLPDTSFSPSASFS